MSKLVTNPFQFKELLVGIFSFEQNGLLANSEDPDQSRGIS